MKLVYSHHSFMSLTSYIKSKLGWFVLLGAGLTLLGLFSIEKVVVADSYSVALLGVLFVLAGMLQLAEGLRTRKWNGSFFNVIQGALYVLGGFSIYARYSIHNFNITILLAFFYLCMALLRIFFSLFSRFAGRLWVLLSGAVSLLSAAALFILLPAWNILIIGFIAGGDLIFYGISMLAFSIGVRARREEKTEEQSYYL